MIVAMRGRTHVLVAAIAAGCGGGAAMHSPDAGGSAQPPTLLAAVDRPFAIAVAGDLVYVLTAGGSAGQLVSVPATGGTPTVLASGLSTFEVYGHALVVDATDAYFLTGSGVETVSLAGGSATVFAQPARGSIALAGDGSNVYIATGGAGADAGGIDAVPLGGGSATGVATGPLPTDVAVDASRVYWGGTDGTIDAAPKSGGSATAIGSASCLPSNLAVDATSAYRMCNAGSVFSAPLGGGSATLLDAFDGGMPDGMNGMAIDATSLYWTQTDGDVDRVPLAGETGQGDPVLATGSAGAWGSRATARRSTG